MSKNRSPRLQKKLTKQRSEINFFAGGLAAMSVVSAKLTEDITRMSKALEILAHTAAGVLTNYGKKVE